MMLSLVTRDEQQTHMTRGDLEQRRKQRKPKMIFAFCFASLFGVSLNFSETFSVQVERENVNRMRFGLSLQSSSFLTWIYEQESTLSLCNCATESFKNKVHAFILRQTQVLHDKRGFCFDHFTPTQPEISDLRRTCNGFRSRHDSKCPSIIFRVIRAVSSHEICVAGEMKVGSEIGVAICSEFRN
jgi:hypothetical protein